MRPPVGQRRPRPAGWTRSSTSSCASTRHCPARACRIWSAGCATRVPQWRRELKPALQRARQRLSHARVDGVEWYWPADEIARHGHAVRSRCICWRRSIRWSGIAGASSYFWGWAYRFEAYTPAKKRTRGYYALPLLWRDRVIGWGNISVEGRRPAGRPRLHQPGGPRASGASGRARVRSWSACGVSRPRLTIAGSPVMRPKPQIPAEIEDYRDERWCREGTRQIETALDAERFIERVGFAACLTDSRRPGPSLYVAVCGRRDAVMPRNVQKDPEASLTWVLKDEVVGARQGLLRQTGARQDHVPRAADDPLLPCRVGRAPVRRETPAERARANDPEGAPPRVGDGLVRPAGGIGDQGPPGIHQSARRAAGRDDRHTQPGRSISQSSPTSGRSASDGLPTRSSGARAARPRCAKSPAAFSRARA